MISFGGGKRLKDTGLVQVVMLGILSSLLMFVIRKGGDESYERTLPMTEQILPVKQRSEPPKRGGRLLLSSIELRDSQEQAQRLRYLPLNCSSIQMPEKVFSKRLQIDSSFFHVVIPEPLDAQSRFIKPADKLVAQTYSNGRIPTLLASALRKVLENQESSDTGGRKNAGRVISVGGIVFDWVVPVAAVNGQVVDVIAHDKNHIQRLCATVRLNGGSNQIEALSTGPLINIYEAAFAGGVAMPGSDPSSLDVFLDGQSLAASSSIRLLKIEGTWDAIVDILKHAPVAIGSSGIQSIMTVTTGTGSATLSSELGKLLSHYQGRFIPVVETGSLGLNAGADLPVECNESPCITMWTKKS